MNNTPEATRSGSSARNVVVDRTVEVRWFFDEQLPDAVHRWFTHDGSTGLSETRRDVYRLDDRADVGVKLRFERVLEFKQRQGPARPFRHRELVGKLERWWRWSPADGVLPADIGAAWIDVDKAVVKRRFDVDGRELELSDETRAMWGRGCDVEIAALSMRGRPAWTFALAAFGPTADHGALLTAALDTVLGVHGFPGEFLLTEANSAGYPAWIAGRDRHRALALDGATP